MARTRRHWLVGRRQSGYRRLIWLFTALLLFLTTFIAYASDVFTIPGGIVWIPGDAALVGFVVAVLVGYHHGGLLSAWLVTYAALLGYRADHAFLGLSSQTRPERAAYFLRLDGLSVLAVEALVIGLLAFLLGTAIRWGATRFQQASLPND